MSTLVESLRRLFFDGKVTEEKLTQMVAEGKLTAEEQAYITTPEPSSEDEYKQYYETVNQAILGGAG